MRSELFDSERGRPFKLKPDELRRSMVPTLLRARKPLRDGEGEVGREPGVEGGVDAGGVAAVAIIRSFGDSDKMCEVEG